MGLFSYKMTRDTGFAPNPFKGFLTLATCKPKIRKYKTIGDWIAGFTSTSLNNDPVGQERLVFLMYIDDQITFAEYWNNPKYITRKPDIHSEKVMDKIGDNIYRPLKLSPQGPSDFVVIENLHHMKDVEKAKDLNGENVLISNHFYYFGEHLLVIPDTYRPTVPKGLAPYGLETKDVAQADRFVNYIQENYKSGIYNHPHKWFTGDTTWMNDENYIKS